MNDLRVAIAIRQQTRVVEREYPEKVEVEVLKYAGDGFPCGKRIQLTHVWNDISRFSHDRIC